MNPTLGLVWEPWVVMAMAGVISNILWLSLFWATEYNGGPLDDLINGEQQ